MYGPGVSAGEVWARARVGGGGSGPQEARREGPRSRLCGAFTLELSDRNVCVFSLYRLFS